MRAPPKILAWVPAVLVIAIVVVAMLQPGSPGPDDLVLGGIRAAMHGDYGHLWYAGLVLGAAFVQIGIAAFFAVHMANNGALKRKGAWIAGGVLVGSIVLPIYAHRRMGA